MNIVQHYNTFNKGKVRGKRRFSVLCDAGFRGTPHTLFNDAERPIKQAKELADKMSDEFGKAVHLVLLDGKNMNGNTGYVVMMKFI